MSISLNLFQIRHLLNSCYISYFIIIFIQYIFSNLTSYALI